MNAENKTHYRKAFHSPYLSSADITEPTILTISHVVFESDKTKKTKESFNTAYFVEKEIRQGEPLKPMVLNATNSKALAGIAQSPFLEDWKNIQIIVQVQSGIRFGKEVVDGLRISKVSNARQGNYAQKPPITAEIFAQAMGAVSTKTRTVEQITSKYKVSDEQLDQLNKAASGA